jgi:hypothetical protein
MVGQPDLPPWEPIADWLARLPNVSCDEEHEDTREPTNATQAQIRDRYEKTAKAVAYDIYMSKHEQAEQIEQDMKRRSPKIDTGCLE